MAAAHWHCWFFQSFYIYFEYFYCHVFQLTFLSAVSNLLLISFSICIFLIVVFISRIRVGSFIYLLLLALSHLCFLISSCFNVLVYNFYHLHHFWASFYWLFYLLLQVLFSSALIFCSTDSSQLCLPAFWTLQLSKTASLFSSPFLCCNMEAFFKQWIGVFIRLTWFVSFFFQRCPFCSAHCQISENCCFICLVLYLVMVGG